MPVASVVVSGKLVLPSGLPAAFATIRFVLTSPSARGERIVVPYAVRAIADAAGLFSIRVAPSQPGAHYTVQIAKASGLVLLNLIAVVPDTDCTLSQVVQLYPPSPVASNVAALNDLQAALIDIELAKQQVLSISAALDAREPTVNVIAGEALGGNRAVVLQASGLAVYADNSNPVHFWQFAGITTGAAAAASPLKILPAGLMVEPSWAWLPNTPVFLGRTGLLTQEQVPGVFQQVIGTALSPTSVFISPREPIFTT
jgi:hypothetical protein